MTPKTEDSGVTSAHRRCLFLTTSALLWLSGCSSSALLNLNNLGSAVVGQPCVLDDDCTTNLCLSSAPDGGPTCQCSGIGGPCALDGDCCIAGSTCCQDACEPGACPPLPP